MMKDPAHLEQKEKKMLKKLDKLNRLVFKYKYQHHYLVTEYKNWIRTISSAEFGLVEYLIKVILDNKFIFHETRENAFQLLRQLYTLNEGQNEEEVTELILGDKKFLIFICSFLPTISKKKSNENYFFFLILFTQKGLIKWTVSDKESIEALFWNINSVNDSEILEEICIILVEICSFLGEEKFPFFLSIYKGYPMNFLFNEILIRLLRKPKYKEKENQILDCLIKLMNSQQEPIFAKSDMESFIDIILDKLNVVKDDNSRLFFLKSLSVVTHYDFYYSTFYKIDEIVYLLEEIQTNYEGETDGIREEGRNIVVQMLEDHRRKAAKNNPLFQKKKHKH